MLLPRKESTYSEVLIVLSMAFGNSIILSLSILFGAEVSQNYFTLTHNKIMLIVVSEIIMFLLIWMVFKGQGMGL